MIPSVWRFLCFLLVAILVCQNVVLWLATNKSLRQAYGFPLSLEDARASGSDTAKSWTFNVTEDANNFAL